MVKTAVCTICSNNYLPYARTLMASVAEQQPDWDRFVLLVDEAQGVFDPSEEPYEVIEARELALPDPKRFFFRYTILELNTAVKPWLLEQLLFERGYDRVIYIDPDIRLYSPLIELEAALDEGANIVLTPHLTGRLDDGLEPTELDILRSGTWNLGFVALARGEVAREFLGWWQEKLEFKCVVDIPAGLFVDQKWCDMVPGMFDGVFALRHEGYNVAYWNLAHREVLATDSGYEVNGAPLRFFHFSGIDPRDPGPFSKHQTRFRLDSIGDAKPLAVAYAQAVMDAGYVECRGWKYAYANFADGVPIPDIARWFYRDHPELDEEFGEDPFAVGHELFNRPWRRTTAASPPVTRLMRAIWHYRADLQRTFPDIVGAQRMHYASWFALSASKEMGIDEAFTGYVRRSLSEGGGAAGLAGRQHLRVRRILLALKPLGRRLPTSLKRRMKRALPMLDMAAPSSQSVSPPVGRARGFFPRDFSERREGSAWMSNRVEIVSPELQGGSTLLIVGEHIARLHERGGDGCVQLRASIEGVEVGVALLEEQGYFQCEFELAPELEGARMIELSADRTIQPSRYGDSTDARELSVRIQRVEVGSLCLLDFTQDDVVVETDEELDELLPRPSAVAKGGGLKRKLKDVLGNPPAVQVARWGERRPAQLGGGLPLGVNVIGYTRAETGVGESARLCVQSLQAAEVPFSLMRYSGANVAAESDARLSALEGKDPRYFCNLWHVNADQTLAAIAHHGEQLYSERYNVGVWHWELPELLPEWKQAADALDEIWAPSRFVLEAVRALSDTPVHLMPHGLSLTAPRSRGRAQFGLPEAPFTFLSMFDVLSIPERKNPRGTLEAFRRAFPSGTEALLVIKVNNSEHANADYQAFRTEAASTPGVHLLERNLPREEVYELTGLADALVSLHRSEGFGLGPFEAMSMGKPVISTDWSGTADFVSAETGMPVDYELVQLERDHGPYPRGATWAEPDLEHAAQCMRRLVQEPELATRLGKAARVRMLADFSPSSAGANMSSRLTKIHNGLIQAAGAAY